MTYEVNFDGIVGPTHNYSGLSWGNIASVAHHNLPSNPKQAALQGLDKMKFLHDNGIKQGVLPPHPRPHLPMLRRLGFNGTDEEVVMDAYNQAPELLFACSSAAAMWTANAATITPSRDARDGTLHITPANLKTKFHRALEAAITSKVLKAIFPFATHHPPVPFSDEGAANHTRLAITHGDPGLHLFVYGRHSLRPDQNHPHRFPARQTFEASEVIARLHQIPEEQVLFAQQHPKAIDAGVFHNDVASVGNETLFFYHEEAFVNTPYLIEQMEERLPELIAVEVPASRISLEEAVSTYLFNSQIVTKQDGKMLLIAPTECQENGAVGAFIRELEERTPIDQIHFFNLKESMQNGGGPACLRLRVLLTEEELAQVYPGVLMSDELYRHLRSWIEFYYREELVPKDLGSPELLAEVREALVELQKVLGISLW